MRIVDPVNDPGWDHVVALHRDAGCFHTSAWAKVLQQTYNHQPFYLQFSRRRRLAALIPLMEVRSLFTGRRGVCLPFSDTCEPLIFDPEAVGLVRDHLVRFAQERRWKHLERRGGKFFQGAPSSATKCYGHTLDLRSGAEELATRFASPVRRAIRKAERSGVKAVVARSRGFIVLAQHGPHPIAAAIFFRFGRNALYKYGASDKRFQALRANNLVMWQGIQFLAHNGAEKLHFGRTEQENEGLRRFKLSWNTQEETIDYFRVDPSGRQCLAPARSHDSGLHKKVFGRLPLMFNRLAGSMIYPHLD